MLNDILTWVQGFVGTNWIYLVMYGFATLDGFFPPVPSESIVIAMSSLALSTGEPNLLLLVTFAAMGAFTGDQLAYQVGRMTPVRTMRAFRSPRGQRTLDWAEHALKHRGASFIIAARYIPVARIAVNMSAGALHYKRQKFLVVDAVASLLWAWYSAGIGITAGAVLGDHPLLAIVVGVALGMILGVIIDWLIQKVMVIRTRLAKPPPTPESEV